MSKGSGTPPDDAITISASLKGQYNQLKIVFLLDIKIFNSIYFIII